MANSEKGKAPRTEHTLKKPCVQHGEVKNPGDKVMLTESQAKRLKEEQVI